MLKGQEIELTLSTLSLLEQILSFPQQPDLQDMSVKLSKTQ